MRRTILVATDGSSASLGALRLATALQARHGHAGEVLGVVEPVPVFDAGFLVALPELELDESRQSALREEIQECLRALGGLPPSWAVRVEAGLPGPRIVKRAEEVGASLIVLGLGRHRPLDRVFGTETALQVIRLSHIPVLAVPEDFTGLPRSAALGVDFSGFSQRAARVVLGVMDSPWELHLVHVMSGLEFLPTLSEDWRAEYEKELRERLGAVGETVPCAGGCKVHTLVLEGEPAHEILGFVEGRGVEMIVAGSHGLSFMGRVLMGSVSTRLLRSARVPILVVPPEQPVPELEAAAGRQEDTHPWVRELQQFSKANAGRRSTLELHDPDVGVQECGRRFPLWGVDYDPRADRIDIMLGRSGTVEGHLTHSLTSPREVEILKDEEGVSLGLRIRLANGQVILRLHRD